MTGAICCTLKNCSCENFRPSKLKKRQCDTCKHGWVSHALSKLKTHQMYDSSQVEIVHSNVVFDICSLMLYGTQAIPIRLKILLDRLFSVLKQEEVSQILNALDWTLQDYIRGYILQDVAGNVLDRWAVMTFEEELATLQQFLRFGETKSIVELMALQDKEGESVLVPSLSTNSDIRTFIERSTHHTATMVKIEKVNSNNMHHFENLMNSMNFMLPFQLLCPVPAPTLGSATGPIQHLPQQNEQLVIRENLIYHSHSAGTSLNLFENDVNRCDRPMESFTTTSPKIEIENFSTSDNYSDGPSKPCTPSIRCDITHMSPDGKLRPMERSVSSGTGTSRGASLKKSRVFCNACEKTFYDKGTLKIHYNAVHLKIKHKCTIEGCNMVFSSLRSRNRHSANPNPRLHMPMNRNNRDKDLRSELSADEVSHSVGHVETGSKVSSGCFSSIRQNSILFPNLKTVQPVLPFYHSLVTPRELANTSGSPPTLPLLSTSVPATPIPEFYTTDPVPKKKSRKSSMPIKIEKEKEGEDGEPLKIGSCFEVDNIINKHQDECDSSRTVSSICVKQAVVKENKGARSTNKRGEKQNVTQNMDEETMGCSRSSDLKAVKKHDFGQKLNEKEERHQCEEFEHICENQFIGDHFGPVRVGLDGLVDHFIDSSLSEIDDISHHCEVCHKTFKNPPNTKLHYENIQCTVDGCNATVSSRRSRDRHSGNLKLHYKQLTKDTVQSKFLKSSSNCGYTDLAYCQDPNVRESNIQSLVFSGGQNCIGQVFPRKEIIQIKVPDSSNTSPIVEDEMVLDLSTSSCRPPKGKSESSCEGARSDGGECLEEDKDQLIIEDSDESCDYVNVGKDDEEDCTTGRLGNHCTIGRQQFGLQGIGNGPPITCHICHKVYSNKGTFRAHYKTVHLRLLHKCKVPGCDTSFSSVRSRNRHSQNPNLHKNLAIMSGLPIKQD
ncbi:zinc finger protein basonuclin-1 isoform X2 [Synchiropus splendidus]|uniref:zinc finger protein basonuclin-1 isoform X2 n=1 Tax=Synchiropus splendidus TaxID=270530 RepID=UPI00237E5D34|nr:zinc finger protein basonuclin-1 isoform X2 [Synchiropus splendidus]